jgi:hypothetical protein
VIFRENHGSKLAAIDDDVDGVLRLEGDAVAFQVCGEAMDE